MRRQGFVELIDGVGDNAREQVIGRKMHKRCGRTRRGDGQIARAERINFIGQIGVRLGVFFTRHGSAVNNDFGAIGVGMLHDRGEIGNVDFDVGWNDGVARMVELMLNGAT